MRGMEPGKVRCAGRRFVEIDAKHDIGCAGKPAGLARKCSVSGVIPTVV